MSVKTSQRLLGYSKTMGFDKNPQRIDNDFYPTPSSCVYDILRWEMFEGTVNEPACGNGAISKILEDKGYVVFSSDLVDRGFGTSGVDFLKTQTPMENIITNPPFSLGTKFAIHGLNLVQKKMILFNKLSFLEGKTRYDKLYSQEYLETVYVYSKRQSFGEGNSGMIAFAWFVWNKKFQGNPTIKWI